MSRKIHRRCLLTDHISTVAPYSLFLSLYENRYTWKGHAKSLRLLEAYCDRRGMAPEDVTRENILDLSRELREAGLCASSIRQMFCTFRVFYRYLEALDRVKKSPAVILHFVKTAKIEKLPLPLHPLDRIALMSALRTDTREHFQISLAVRLGMECGLRVAEMAALPRAAAHLHTDSLIVTGKRGKTRNIPMTAALKSWIQKWFSKTTGKYFFPHRCEPAALHIKADRINVWMKRAALWAGIKPFTVHRLRDTFGSVLAETGATAPEIKELMGHGSLWAADHYVRLCGNQAQEAHRRAFGPKGENFEQGFGVSDERRRAS